MEFDRERGVDLVHSSAKIENSVVIEPCFIGEGAVIENSVIGPHVSVNANSEIRRSVIENTIIQSNTIVEHANLSDSMIGNNAKFKGSPEDYSMGDYGVIEK